MVSGFSEVASIKYHLHIGKSGDMWMVGDCETTGESVYVSGGKGSRGFGGGTVRFELSNGFGFVDLIGPWHSNTDCLFKDTGVDVRNTFRSWGCVGTEQFYDDNTGEPGIGNILWFDDVPRIGAFDRVDKIAKKMQRDSKVPLFYYRETRGGSSLGSVSP